MYFRRGEELRSIILRERPLWCSMTSFVMVMISSRGFAPLMSENMRRSVLMSCLTVSSLFVLRSRLRQWLRVVDFSSGGMQKSGDWIWRTISRGIVDGGMCPLSDAVLRRTLSMFSRCAMVGRERF